MTVFRSSHLFVIETNKDKTTSKAELLPGLVTDWGGFEQFVAELNKTAQDVVVEHNVELIDRFGVPRQIDVVVRYKVGLINHLVVVECKFWKTNVPREKVDAFVSTVSDLNASHGIIFSAVGFQSGAVETAKAHGISLFKVREPTPDEWGAPGRYVDIVLVCVATSIGSLAFPGALGLAGSAPIQLDLRVGQTKTVGVINSGQQIVLEDFLQTRAHVGAKQILQQEANKGLPFFPENGRRLVWKNVRVLFHPTLLQLPSIPSVFIPEIDIAVGIDIMQTRIRTDRAASYTFAVAVEDCITNGVTGATRRPGEELTSQFNLQPKYIDPSDLLKNGSIIVVWTAGFQPFTEFATLAQGQPRDGEIPQAALPQQPAADLHTGDKTA